MDVACLEIQMHDVVFRCIKLHFCLLSIIHIVSVHNLSCDHQQSENMRKAYS